VLGAANGKNRGRPLAKQFEPIPPHLSQAFREAVWHYASWAPSAAEIEVNIKGAFYSMSAVCSLVDNFEDELPDEIIEKLMSYIRDIRYTLLRQKLLDRKTYAAGARCFLRLIEDRKRQAAHHTSRC